MHQCPRCELRFPAREELRDHLSSDHDWTPEQLGEAVTSTPEEIARRR